MAFDPTKVTIHDKSYGESDEGDYDSYTIHVLQYDGEEFLRIRNCASSNIGGAWGSEHKILEMDGKSCTVQEFKVGGTVGSRGRSSEAKGSPIVYDLKTEWESFMKKKKENNMK